MYCTTTTPTLRVCRCACSLLFSPVAVDTLQKKTAIHFVKAQEDFFFRKNESSMQIEEEISDKTMKISASEKFKQKLLQKQNTSQKAPVQLFL